jgi:SOS-response transcriptional repressor LexA
MGELPATFLRSVRTAKAAPAPRQIDVMRLIESGRRANGHPPTIRELADQLGIKSTNGVADHLRALENKGLITWSRGKGRTLALTPAGRRWLPRSTPEAA